MTTDSDRILAAGKAVTFADGSTRTLHFGFLAMKFVEDEMGGLLGALEAFGVRFDEEDGSARRFGIVKIEVAFTTVAKAIACGIAEEFIDQKGKLPQFETVFAWVLKNADTTRLTEYAQAGYEALSEAIPDTNGGRTEEEQTDPTTAAMPPPPPANGSQPSDSLGETSTTSPQFVTAEAPATSGG